MATLVTSNLKPSHHCILELPPTKLLKECIPEAIALEITPILPFTSGRC